MSNYTQKQVGGLYELTDVARSELVDSKYYNEDLAPTTLTDRTWNTYNISMLWVGMSICIPTLMMASGLVIIGFSPLFAVLNVVLGNVLILIPIQLNSHAGTKYGIPFPVFARLTFGPIGAHLPSISRAVTACGWNAVQCTVGGAAIISMVAAIVPSVGGGNVSFYVGFFLFLVLTWLLTVFGAKVIRIFESIGSPILLILCVALLIWSVAVANGAGANWGEFFLSGNAEKVAESGGAVSRYLFGLMGNIAFWATMALNIPDFSRYAKNQKVQFRGQLFGMPLTMAFCAFIGAVFAQAVLSGFSDKGVDVETAFNPTAILSTDFLGDTPTARVVMFIVGLGVIVATLTTNIAANVVAPANGFSNLAPKKISYAMGTTIACLVAVAYQLIFDLAGSVNAYYGFLNTYGDILAPVAAIFIADYYVIKKRNVDVFSLYSGEGGRYWYSGGWNVRAFIAWGVAFILPVLGAHVLPGVPFFSAIASVGYVFGFIVAFVVYVLLMKGDTKSFLSTEEEAALTEKVQA